MVVDSYPVKGSVCALEGHVVRDEAEVSLVHVDTVHVKHSRDFSDDGLVCSFDPVVFCSGSGLAPDESAQPDEKPLAGIVL